MCGHVRRGNRKLGFQTTTKSSGLRDPVYGRGEDAGTIIKSLKTRDIEKVAEKLRDEIMTLPEKLKHKILTFLIEEGNKVLGSGIW